LSSLREAADYALSTLFSYSLVRAEHAERSGSEGVGCPFLERAVGALGLTVGLRVKGGRHGEFGAEAAPQVAPEMGGETRVVVAEDGLEHIVVTDDPRKKRRASSGAVTVVAAGT
jgi:hypothetical protein